MIDWVSGFLRGLAKAAQVKGLVDFLGAKRWAVYVERNRIIIYDCSDRCVIYICIYFSDTSDFKL